jgi:hypothetical protein
MKLYRGYKTTPKMFIPKLAEELEELNRKAEGIKTSDLVEFIKQMGAEAVARRAELQQIAGKKFFTDDEANARDFAGENGFVMTLEIPDEIAQKHYEGEQVMSAGDTPRYGSNFVFTGRELQDHLDEWKFDVVNLEEERASAEREKTERVSEGKTPIDKTVYGNADLDPESLKHLNEFREKMIKKEGGKSPFGGGESRL